MDNKENLETILKKIDGKGYKAYKKIQNNSYDFSDFKLTIPYVQGDPFASPSSVFIRVKQNEAGFPDWIFENNIRKQAVEDYLTRMIAGSIRNKAKGSRGSGKSGQINIARFGQEVLERTSVEFTDQYIECRLTVGLPARGRRVLGYQARDIFFEELPAIVAVSMFYQSLNAEQLQEHILVVEDQVILRDSLSEKQLIAFIANGSTLPRKSGIEEYPLEGKRVKEFVSPTEVEVEFELPYAGKIKGMGIKPGITLIVGGGYHGKSTLLKAIERGVYNHIPGDGREYVVSREDAFKIRAEDGRRVTKVDISPFINNLPQGDDTRDFSSENASGSTSQTANIIEALELGAGIFLIDEDTCASNFMIRDARMQRLVSGDKEPITPFIDKVRALYQQHEISTIMVVGGAGDYFDVANQVIMMDQYVPVDVTSKTKAIVQQLPSNRCSELVKDFGLICKRFPDPSSINPRRGGKIKVGARDQNVIQFGSYDIDVSYIEQLLNTEQAQTIADILLYGVKKKIIDGQKSLKESLEEIFARIDREGLKIISPFENTEGSYVRPRLLEVGATLNRLRSLRIRDIRWEEV